MNEKLWTAVDEYLTATLVEPDAVLEGVLQANAAAGLPPIDVAPNQGKFLHLLVRMRGARRILEIGTLGGYSTIWLARALPEGGRMVTLEFSEHHARVAAENLKRAGLSAVVEVRVGPALDTLARMGDEGVEAFDFIFIDADKPNNPAYLEWALRFSRPGTVIVGDNVIRDGAVKDAESKDPRVLGVRRFLKMLAEDPRVDATALQTVGMKGYDGFAFGLVR